jgi:hypothetical protein
LLLTTSSLYSLLRVFETLRTHSFPFQTTAIIGAGFQPLRELVEALGVCSLTFQATTTINGGLKSSTDVRTSFDRGSYTWRVPIGLRSTEGKPTEVRY